MKVWEKWSWIVCRTSACNAITPLYFDSPDAALRAWNKRADKVGPIGVDWSGADLRDDRESPFAYAMLAAACGLAVGCFLTLLAMGVLT